MKKNDRKASAGPILFIAVLTAVLCCLLSACSSRDNAEISRFETTSQTEYIGQDKESVGYYKRIGYSKAGETLEEMKASLDIMKKGYLVLKDDGTAFFELDGEITEYTFDKQNFYLTDDTEKKNGFPYTYIGGRLIVNDGTSVTQYLRLTDEELGTYLKNRAENTSQSSGQ